jgi:hypothetical protein
MVTNIQEAFLVRSAGTGQITPRGFMKSFFIMIVITFARRAAAKAAPARAIPGEAEP